MYIGAFAIVAYFIIVPGICELCVYLYNRKGGKNN